MFQLKRFLQDLRFSKETNVYLLNNLAEMHNTINLAFLDLLVNKRKRKGIYVTLNKPYPALVVDLKRRKVDLDKLSIIDCISGKKMPPTKNCVFVQNPASIFELSHQISEIKKRGDYSFLFIDSAINLFWNNPEKQIINFIKFHTLKTVHLEMYIIISSIDHRKTKKIFTLLEKEFEHVKIIDSTK